jgi:lysophospholipase L1-like esterase
MLRYLFSASLLLLVTMPAAAGDKVDFPFRQGDRVAWIGSSSTNIGVWPKTMEFLLRTRHPELKLTFKRYSTGGGTFDTGLKNLDKWLADGKPTLVFLNYGSNDATAGDKGLPAFKDNIVKCVDKVKNFGARVLLMNGQSADVRKSGVPAAQRREAYAEAMLKYAKEKNWPPVVDVFHPLDELQKNGQKDDDKYTILKDNIHLTDPAYIAWGYFLYQGLNPINMESVAVVNASGTPATSKRCKIVDLKATDTGVSFTREDEVLPILPPVALPPRKHVPLEQWSAYGLQVNGLAKGDYEIRFEGKLLGKASAEALDKGINLNTLLLDGTTTAPWETLARQLWDGKESNQIGKTRWRFEVNMVK